MRFLGHLYPVYFGFRGGKGDIDLHRHYCSNQSIGVPGAFDHRTATDLLDKDCFDRFFGRRRLLSAFNAVGGFFQGSVSWLDFSFSVVIALLVIWMHRANIKRLLNGTENRFGSKKQVVRRKNRDGEDCGDWAVVLALRWR